MPLPVPVSPTVRRTMTAAFEDLRNIIAPADARGFSETTVEQVRSAALDIEKQLALRQCLRNMRRLIPLFNGLEHYSHVMGVLCNGVTYLPWAWAPISFILRVSSEYVEAFDRIVKGYSRLAESLKRFFTIGETFARKADSQQTLAVFYVDILKFHGFAYKFVTRSEWKILFFTSWGRFQRRFDNILEDMRRHENLVGQEANHVKSEKMRDEIREWREKSGEQLTAYESEQAAKQFESAMAWLKSDEADQLAHFERVSAEGEQYPGTCKWFTQNDRVQAWLKRSSNSPILWIKGPPGSGKSVLSSQLVKDMQKDGMSVAYHFCTYSCPSSTTYEQILRSLISQLLRRDDDVVAYVYGDCVLGKKTPTVAVLEQLLQSLINSLAVKPHWVEYVWILLDGLDECEENKQKRTISLMKQLASSASSTEGVVCKVIIFSRTAPAISSRVRKADMLSLSEGKNKKSICDAIRQYTRCRLQCLHTRLDQLHISPRDVDELVDIISRKADGMFLYARLVLDFVGAGFFLTHQQLIDAVNELPEELAEFYNKILSRILSNQGATSVENLKCVLGWIAFAKRPLKKLEFLSAVTFSMGDLNFQHLVPSYIFDITAPLIEERGDTTMAFVHVSVKDFLESGASPVVLNGNEVTDQHGIATLSCLLSGMDVFGEGYPVHDRDHRLVQGLHGLHIYATEYWTEYLLESISATVRSCRQPPSSKFMSLADNLGQRINALCGTTSDDEQTPKKTLDDRLPCLNPYPLLMRAVQLNLRARSLEMLEAELLDNSENSHKPRKDVIMTLLTSYQTALGALLRQHDCPGLSAAEFEQFKSQFKKSAFTCRLASCPRATVGFESEKLCREHELAHVRRFSCTEPDCQYYPFPSAQALRNHVRSHHRTEPPRTIRMHNDASVARSKTRADDPWTPLDTKEEGHVNKITNILSGLPSGLFSQSSTSNISHWLHYDEKKEGNSSTNPFSFSPEPSLEHYGKLPASLLDYPEDAPAISHPTQSPEFLTELTTQDHWDMTQRVQGAFGGGHDIFFEPGQYGDISPSLFESRPALPSAKNDSTDVELYSSYSPTSEIIDHVPMTPRQIVEEDVPEQ